MNVEFKIALLMTAVFLFDSFALGAINRGIVTVDISRPFLSLTISFFRELSLPTLILTYIGSIADIFLTGQVFRHLRVRVRQRGSFGATK